MPSILNLQLQRGEIVNIENKVAVITGTKRIGSVVGKALAEKGMKIMTPSPKLVADFRQVGGIMKADWIKRAGTEGEALLSAYEKSTAVKK